MKVVLIDKNPKTQFRVGHNYPVLTSMPTLAEDLKSLRPDWVFISRKDGMDQVREAIQGYKSAYFYGDYRNPLPQHALQFSRMCDITLTTWKCPVVWKTLKNPHVVRMGTKVEFFHLIPEIEPIYDVAFGGSNFGGDPRMKVLEFLHKNFNLYVVGNGWPANWNTVKRQNLIKLNRHLQKAKITVGVFNRTDMAAQNIEYYTSNRLYQNMAIGRPHIAPTCIGVASFFEAGYIEYRDLEELGLLIKHILKMPQEQRDFIGEVQRNEIVSHHTHAHSWAMMQKVVEDNLF